MRKVVLKDGTVLPKCTDSTTVDTVFIFGETYAEAGGYLDLITPENTKVIKVYDEEDHLVTSGGDLILLPNIQVGTAEGGVTLSFSVRRKTEMEIIKDEISELQDVVIGD